MAPLGFIEIVIIAGVTLGVVGFVLFMAVKK